MFPLRRVAPLLFVSGFCALAYQTVWLRELRLIFGASTSASAAVLAIFMGGLGLGSWLLGRRADRAPNPLMFYANLEILIALAAAVTPLFVWVARAAYVAVGGSAVLGTAGATAARLVLSTLVLLVPTVAMGGTLPAAARAVEHPEDSDRRGVGVLYGVNTLGAVLGTAATTFVLFEIYGNRRTLWLAALVNLLIALVARSIARTARAPAAPAVTAAAPSVPADAERAPVPWLVLAAAAAVGFVFFVLELVWYRLLAPLLGGSTFTFGLILAVALAGIGIGGALYGLGRGRLRPTYLAFALTCALEALFVALPLLLGDDVAVLAAILRKTGVFGFDGLVAGWAVVTAIVVLPAAIISGFQFPLLIGLLGRGERSVGAHVGAAYVANTAGSIVGSLAGGFWLVPVLGAVSSWRLGVWILLVLAAASLLTGLREGGRRWWSASLVGGTVAMAAVFSLATGPTAAWRHAPIGAGRAQLAAGSPAELIAWQRAHRARIAWEVDGLESSVALDHNDGYAFVVNGKSDGNAISDAPTQVMSGVLGALLHPNPRRALVVGLGTGSTAGWLGALPGMEHVEVAEIEPAILDIARSCEPVNRGALTNPKVRVVLGDARELLLVSRDRYDLVFSEPSNPYRAGISSLFTEEFYRAVRSRLTHDGVFVQWVQGYEITPAAIQSVLATLALVFEDVQVWRSTISDVLVLARTHRRPIDMVDLRRRVAAPGYAEALRYGWGIDDAEGVLANFVADDAVARRALATGGDTVNTDDQNLLEFAFARSVGGAGTSIPAILEVATALGAARPEVEGEVDWARVALRTAQATARQYGEIRTDGLDAELARRVAVVASTSGENVKAVALAALGGIPTSPTEDIAIAEVAALSGAADAPAWIERLRENGYLAEAELVRAISLQHQRHHAEAAKALANGLTAARQYPWIPRGLMARSLVRATAISADHPASARLLLEAVEQPFAVELQRRNRLLAHLEITHAAGFEQTCAAAFEAWEPHVPWDQKILEDRLRCYAAAGHRLAGIAEEELWAFSNGVPPTLGDLLDLSGPAENR